MTVIAAVRADGEFESALRSEVKTIFLLNPNILDIEEKVKCAHTVGKRLYVHIDLAEGIGKDKSGLVFLKSVGIDGIISTRSSMIKCAKEAGMKTVQRFFIVDSHSVETTMDALKNSKTDMIEIMPGAAAKAVKIISSKTDIPIIAGGLITTEQEVQSALRAGASWISTGQIDLWKSLNQ